MDAPVPIQSVETIASEAAAQRSAPAWARFLLTNEFGLIALIAIFGALFALGTPGFSSPFNLFTLGRTMAIDIMIGFSMMVVIVTGGLNLSVGAIGVCVAIACGWLLERRPADAGGDRRGAGAGRGARIHQRRADRPLRPA
jgi:ribose transport system permease protein